MVGDDLDEGVPLPASPCVRMCCLDDVTDICLGCFRNLSEITGWRMADHDERLHILARCAQRKAEYRKKHPE